MQSKIVEAQKILNQKNSNPNRALKLLTPLVQDELTPWQAYHLYGMAMLKKRDFSKAMDYLKRAIYSGSEDHGTFHGLAVAAYNLKKFEESETFAEKSVEIRDDHFNSWMILGDSRRELSKLNESLLSYQRCNQINPKNVDVAYKIAQIYRDQGFIGKALEMYDIAIQMNRTHLGAINEKAKILTGQKRYEEALETIESGLNFEPDNIVLQTTCAELKKEMGEYTKALSIYEGILKKHPAYGGIRVNYANILQDLGRFDEAEENYLQANKDFPALMESFSNYLFVQHYNPKKSREEIFEAHKKWDSIYAPENPVRPIPENRDKKRTLRVGLISGGFRKHPVGWMITPALEKLDQFGFDLTFYSNFNQVDEITKRLHDVSSKWHMISGLDDEQLNQLIRQDNIDILIDLSGHAAESRLRTVAMEPAPIIVKWVGGLINTTGLKAIDFLISDFIETPEGAEPFYLEKLVKMPDDYICFNAPDYAPEVSESPFKTNGAITFGCFNNPIKVNEEIMKYWAEIMKKVPNSRLFLKSKQYGNKVYVERIQKIMNRYGIKSNRLIFEGLSPHSELLHTYNRVDIALDPWPYSGGLTTCEALWMGVPVITRPGDTFAGRHSATHLHNAGHSEWIAESWEDYITITVNLANDDVKLSNIRAGLRDEIANSPLCDSDRYAAHLEEALRSMWIQRIEGYEKGLSSDKWQKPIYVKPIENKKFTESKKSQNKPVVPSELMGKTISNPEKRNNGGTSHLAMDHTKKDNPAGNPADALVRHIMDEEIVVYTPDSKKSVTSYVLDEQGAWYEDEMILVREYIRPGMNIIDIGAGVGVYTLSAAKKSGSEGKVVAFEPSPVLNRCLQKNIEENKLSNVEMIDLAVLDEVGKNQFHSPDECLEFGKLKKNAGLEVKTTTLDAWWRLNGNPVTDLIKIDVNGQELNVLKGAVDLLSKNSPLLLFAVSNSNYPLDATIKFLKSFDYEIYQYIPQLRLLAKYEKEEEPDTYLNNLIAVKKDQIRSLINQGLIFDEAVQINKPADDAWLKVFNTFQWGSDKLHAWELELNQNGSAYYKRALNYIATAQEFNIETDPKNRSAKAKYLLGAAQLMIELYNNGGLNHNISISLSLSRVLNDLGSRGQAVSVLKKVIDQQQKIRNSSEGINLPFYLPHYSQDGLEIKTKFDQWLMVRLVEAWLLLKDQSSFYSGETELRMLHLLDANPEAGEEILRRVKTNRLNESTKAQLNGRDSSSYNGLNHSSAIRVVHLAFNHVYSQVMSDMIEYINKNSSQNHLLFVEKGRAIEDYSVDVSHNSSSHIFDYNLQSEDLMKICLSEDVDVVMIHGLFYDWQKEIIKKIGDKKHIAWKLWGGDLYNPIKKNQPIHDVMQYVDSVHARVDGDFEMIVKVYGKKQFCRFGYAFPGLYGELPESAMKKNPPNIIIGNSGDPTNDHIGILKLLSEKKDIQQFRLILPVAYNMTPEYRQKLQAQIKKLGLEKITEFQNQFVHPDEYLNMMMGASMLITAHHRQQGLGNILASLYSGNHTFLRKEIIFDSEKKLNSAWKYLKDHGLEAQDYDELKSLERLSDLPHISDKTRSSNRAIIKEKIGLSAKGKELIQVSEEMVLKSSKS